VGGCCLPTNQALAPDRQRDPALHGRRLEVLGGDLVGLSSPRQAGDRRAEHRVEGIISLDAEIGVHAQLEPRQHAADQLDQLSAPARVGRLAALVSLVGEAPDLECGRRVDLDDGRGPSGRSRCPCG